MTRRCVARGIAIAVLGIAIAAPVRAGSPEPAQRVSVVVEDALPHGPSVDERLEQIRVRIQAALIYPPLARRLELTGITWLRFSIDPHGAAREVELARSSGHRILDQAARRTLARAGRLPWVYGRIEVPVRFSLEGPS